MPQMMQSWLGAAAEDEDEILPLNVVRTLEMAIRTTLPGTTFSKNNFQPKTAERR